MDTVTVVLIGLFTNIVSFEIGNRLVGRNKVSDITCKERRESCNNLVCAKIDALHAEIMAYIGSGNK